MCLFFVFCLVVVCTCVHTTRQPHLAFHWGFVVWLPVAPSSVDGQLLLSTAMFVLAHGQMALLCHVDCRVGCCCLCFDFIVCRGRGEGLTPGQCWVPACGPHTGGNLMGAKRHNCCRMCSLVQSPLECHDKIPRDRYQLGWPYSPQTAARLALPWD